jgi:hypothetical protein
MKRLEADDTYPPTESGAVPNDDQIDGGEAVLKLGIILVDGSCSKDLAALRA